MKTFKYRLYPTRAQETAMSFRFTLEVKRLLELVSEKLGVSMVAIMELAIREFAAKHGVS